MNCFLAMNGVPVFLTNEFRAIEAPTVWIAKVSRLKSRSRATLKQYAAVVGRFLHWLPERAKRADEFQKVHGVCPPPNTLFLSREGIPVTYKMLYSHFTKAGRDPESPRSGITAVTLRRSWATYFVLNALKERNMLGKRYVYDAVVAEELRTNMGHNDVETTYEHYVKLASQFYKDDLIYDLKNAENKDLLRKSGFVV